MNQIRRCVPCGGSGLIMGGGMVMNNCYHCNGSGKIEEPKDDIEFLHLKTTESYQNAIKQIKSIDDKLSHEDAEKVFKDELYKLDKPKRGRPRRELS